MEVVRRADQGDEPNRGPLILAVGWTECSVAALFVIGRVYIRIQKHGRLDAADWLIILALIVASGLPIISVPLVHYGVGRHLDTLTEDQQHIAVMLDWISHGFHIMSTAITKTSMVLFIRQIISKSHNRRMWILYVLVAAHFVISFLCVVFIFAQCSPVEKLWNPLLTGVGYCWDPKVEQGIGYFTGAYAIFVDFVIAFFPITVLWSLQMEWRLKISLMTYMCIGAFASIASIIKTVQISTLAARRDYTWETVDLILWMMTEQFCMIMAACIPPMRSLFVAIYRKLTGASPMTDPSTGQTGPKTKRSYINQSSLNEEHGMARMDPNKSYWRDGPGTSTTTAYRGDADSQSAGSTDIVDQRSDSDELLRDQHLVIMKHTEVTVSEHRS